MQTYTDFLNENMTDRARQKAHFDQIRATDPRFGPDVMTEEQAANVLADVTGFKPFRRFAAGKFQQSMDAFGDATNVMFSEARVGDNPFTGEGGSGETYSNLAKGGGENTARFLGANEEWQGLIGEGTAQIPNIVGQFAMGAVPVVGLPAMMASMYGQGVGAAHQEGVIGGRAALVGAIAPAATLATMGAAKPLTNWASGKMATMMQKPLAKAGVTAAIDDLAKMGGAELTTLLATPGLSKSAQFAAVAGREAIVETAQAGIGVASEILSDIIIDPQAAWEKMQTKDYWVPMLLGEAIEGAGGTILARQRESLKTRQDEKDAAKKAQLVNPNAPILPLDSAPGTETPAATPAVVPSGIDEFLLDYTDPVSTTGRAAEETDETIVNPDQPDQLEFVFANEAKVERGIDPTAPDSDQLLVEDTYTDEVLATQKLNQAAKESRSATEITLEDGTTETIPAKSSRNLNTPAEVVDIAANILTAQGKTSLGENKLRSTIGNLTSIVANKHSDVNDSDALVNVLETASNAADHKDFRFVTEGENYISLRNPGTQINAVYVEVVRDVEGKKVTVSNLARKKETTAFTLDAETMLGINAGQVTRDVIDQRAGVKLTDTEYNTIVKLAEKTTHSFNALPIGLSFGEGHDTVYAQRLQDFFTRTGLHTVINQAGIKIRFAPRARDVTAERAAQNPFDLFSAKNAARAKTYGDNRTFVINRNENNSAESDLHELGHVIDTLLQSGVFGEQYQKEWLDFRGRLDAYARTSVTGSLGRQLTVDVWKAIDAKLGSKTNLDHPDAETHHLKTEEATANIFQGFALSNSKWNTFMKKSYPTLYKFFTELMSTFKKKILDGKTNDSVFDYYSPLFSEGRDILRGMFTDMQQNADKDARNLRISLNRHPIALSGAPLETFTQAWFQNPNTNYHKTLNQVVTDFHTNLEGREASEGDYLELVDNINAIRKISHVASDNGLVPIGQSLWKMPWANRLMNGSLQGLERLRGDLMKGATDDVQRAKIDEIFGDARSFGVLAEDFSSTPEKNQRIKAIMDGKKLLTMSLETMSRAVSEMLETTGKERVGLSDAYIQLGQIDSVIRDWMFGKLDGQNGVPFHDDFVKMSDRDRVKLFTPSNNKENPRSLGIQGNQFQHWFPVLAKAMKARVAHSKRLRRTHVDAKGDFSFESNKGRGKKELKQFNVTAEKTEQMAETEADSYAAMLQQSDKYASVNVRSEAVKNAKGVTKYFRIRVSDSKALKEYNEMIDEQYSMENHKQIMKELLKVPDTGSTEADYARQDMELKRQALASTPGRKVLMRLDQVLPQIVRKALETRVAHPSMMAVYDQTNAWLNEPGSDGLNKLIQLGKAIGMTSKDSFTLHGVAEFWSVHQLKHIKQGTKGHVYADLVDPSQTLSNYFKSIESFAIKAAKMMHGQGMKSLDAGMMPLVDPAENGREAAFANNTVMNDKDVQTGASIVLATLPGGVQARARIVQAEKANILRRIIDKPFKIGQSIMEAIGSGPVHIALARPEFARIGESLWLEVKDATSDAETSTFPLFAEGGVEEDATGPTKFKVKQHARLDFNSPILKIQNNPVKYAKFHDVLRFQLTAGMKLRDAVNSDDPALRQEANELIKSIPQDDLIIYNEALERLYAARYANVQAMYARDQQINIVKFASSLQYTGLFANKSQDAITFAKAFVEAPINTKLEMLTTLGMEADAVPRTVDAYMKLEDAMHQAYAKKFAHLEHITERRMKRYQVWIVFKKESNKEAERGYYDFDKPEEAAEFIKQARANGHQVPSQPKDYEAQIRRYENVHETTKDILANVIKQRQALITVMLAGEADQAKVAEVVNSLQDVVLDVSNESEVALANKSKFAERKFVKGRENLDMLDQYLNEVRAMSAAKARNSTDVMFKLFSRDESALTDPSTFNTLENFRKGIRQKDSDTQRVIGEVGFTMFMGWNISSAVVEVFQFPTTLTPMLLEMGASLKDATLIPARMFAKASKAAIARLHSPFTAGSHDGIWEPGSEYANLIREWERSGKAGQTRHHDISQSNLDQMTEHLRLMSSDKKTMSKGVHMAFQGMNKFYGFFNRINAELSLVSTYEVMKRTKYGKGVKLDSIKDAQKILDLQNQAMLMNDVANGSLQRVGRPKWFNAPDQSSRNMASAYWSLQSFVNSMVLNQIRMTRKWINSEGRFTKSEQVAARKAVTALFGFQVLGTGVMGITLAPSIGKLIEEVFGLDMEEEMREFIHKNSGGDTADKLFLADLAANGFLSAMDVPIDYGTRVSVANIGPLSSFEGIDPTQLGGPIAGLGTSLFRDIKRYTTGTIGAEKVALNLLPMGLRRGIKMEFIDDGKVYDGNNKYMFDATVGERIGAWAGFNSTRARKIMKARMERTEAQMSDMRRREKLYNELRDANLKRDVAKMNELFVRGEQEFGQNRVQLARGAAEYMTSRDIGQDVREGSGPASQRAKMLFPLANETQETKKLQHVANYMQQLGVQSNISQRTMQKAQQRDYLRPLNPSAVKWQLNDMIEDPRNKQTMFDVINPSSSLPEFLQGAGFR